MWNWKAAVMSVMLRSPLFVMAGLQGGVRAAVVAGAIDATFRSGVAGVIGAITQRLAEAPPSWAVTTGALIAVPLVSHSAEALVHWTAATPHWDEALRASVAVSIVSTLFNLHVMRRGVLVAGASGQPLGADLRRMPALIVSFVRRPL